MHALQNLMPTMNMNLFFGFGASGRCRDQLKFATTRPGQLPETSSVISALDQKKQYFTLLSLLLHYGASVNATDSSGYSPLHLYIVCFWCQNIMVIIIIIIYFSRVFLVFYHRCFFDVSND